MHFLDGVRGLAALYVVIFHIWQFSFFAPGSSPSWHRSLVLLTFGRDAVTVFIVLSGFCLMLPLVRRQSDQLTASLGEYFFRRSRRILPPYFAALILCAILYAVLPTLEGPLTGIHRPVPNSGLLAAVAAHLLLVHNLSPAWVYRFDGPMWSVATEWQIYFLFPFVLLPIDKALGSAATIAAGFCLGAVSLLPQLSSASFWYIGSFAVGMAAAKIAFSSEAKLFKRASSPISFFLLLLVWIISKLLGGHAQGEWVTVSNYLSDIIGSLSTGALLVWLSTQSSAIDEKQAKSPLIYRLFTSVPATSLGAFSYSLYLTHYPVLLAEVVILKAFAKDAGSLLLELLLTLPIVLAVAYIFYTLFEKRFMNNPR